MKKLKKVSLLLLALVLVFSMTACAKKRTAKEVLEASNTKSQEMTSTDMSGTMKFSIETSDTDSAIDMSTSFDAKISDLNKDDMKMVMNTKLSLMGQDMDMDVYYADGYYYTSMAGQKQKMQMDLASIQEQLKQTTGQTTLSSKYYEDLKLEEDDDGNQVLSYSLNEEGLNEYLKDVMSQMTSITGSTSSNSEDLADSIKISSFSGTRTIDKDDNPVKESLKMVMESKDSSDVGKITMSMDVTYNNPGKEVTVTLPDDLSTYTEVTTATTTATQTQ